MIDFLRAAFGGVNADVIASIVVAGLVALFWLGQSRRISKQTVPALMTSLGIFGTFWGIFVALSAFSGIRSLSPDNITESIRGLLSGMETAFVTSLLGLGAAIAARMWWSLPGQKEKPEESPEQESILRYLDAIKRAIAGDDDASLVTQMVKLRDENRDGFKKMDGLAEAIRDALVKNLAQLMQDLSATIKEELAKSLDKLSETIEQNLGDKLGETFDTLNDSVNGLNQWQKEHRQQVERLTRALTDAEQGIRSIRENCEEIPTTMNGLKDVVGTLDEQTRKIKIELDNLEKTAGAAAGHFGAINANLNNIANRLDSSAKEFEGMEETVQNIFNEFKTQADKVVKDMVQQVTNSQSEMKASQDAYIRQMHDEINKVANEWGSNMLAIARRCDEAIRRVADLSAGNQR